MIRASTLKVSCYFFSSFSFKSFDYASSDYYYVWNYSIISTFIRDVNCQHFCFSCNLSVFGSQFNLHIFWNCVNLICTPVNSLVKKNSLFIWLIDIFGAHFRKQCSKQSSLSSYVKNFFCLIIVNISL